MGLFKTKKGSSKKQIDSSNKKIKKSSDITKLTEKIEQEQTEIEQSYLEIGKQYYEFYKDENDEKILPLCNVIDESKRIICLCEKQILYLQGIQLCPVCQAELSLDSLFCNKCGARLDDDGQSESTNESADKAANPADIKIMKCRECGSDIVDDSVFCTNCGAKIK